MWLRPSKLIGNVVALSFCAFMGCLLHVVSVFPAFGYRFARLARSAAGVVSPLLPRSHGRGGITHTAAWASGRPARQAGKTRAGLDQAGAEGQAGEVGAAPAPGLIADAV